MAQKYDAVVIGAGLGGLSAAGYLARRGRKVLLLERHNVPGGYATSFVRGRFEFEVALHELSGMGRPGEPGGLHHYLEKLGVLDKVEIVHAPYFYRSVFPDLDVRLPVGVEAFEQTMCGAFPNEAKGIRRFLKRLHDLHREFTMIYKLGMSGKLPAGDLAKLPLNVGIAGRYAMSTWADVLNRDVRDPRARAVLSQIWGYLGMAPSKLSYLYFAIAMASYIQDGPTYIKGRSQALSQAFVRAFEERGGEARFNCAAEKILVKNRRIVGVVTERGDEVATSCVISNADPVFTCRELIGPKHTPEKFWRRLRSCTVGASSFNVYLGLAATPQRLGITDHETFVNLDYNQEMHYEKMKYAVSPPAIAVTCYNSIWPEISPPDTSIVVLTALMYGEPWRRIKPADYVDVKTSIADDMLRLAERIAPGLRERAEVVEVSTPITNMRYANQLGGSIYGFDQPPGEAMIFRMPHWGPLKGLFFCGAWTPPGGGFEPVMISGRLAAEQALMTMKAKRPAKGA